jgi:hypothetical protein
MSKTNIVSCVMLVLGGCCVGCDIAAKQPTADEYPPVLPIWIVEDDPSTTIFDRKDLERDRKVGKMLVIPLYRFFQHDGATNFLAVAHPFVYEQGEDIEKHLSSFEQRKNLRRLIFWVPGYFPDGLGRISSWTPIINDKRMIVLELQRCMGSEDREVNSAMKSLLLDRDFVIGGVVGLAPAPPPYTPAKMSNDRYDAPQLVRSVKYAGRYYNHQAAENVHVLWAFNPGTRIVNRLSDEERKTVKAFAAEAIEETKRSAKNVGEGGE